MHMAPGPAGPHLQPWVRCAVVLLPLLHTACSFEEGCTLIQAPEPPTQGIHGVLTRTLAVPYEGYAECTAGPIPQGEVCARDITRRFCARTDSLGGYRLELPTGQFQICAALAGEGCSPTVEVRTGRSRRVDLCTGRWTVDTPCDTESTYDAGREAPTPSPPDPPSFQWVIILDTTHEDAPVEAPGADLCEVVATCRGADLTPIRAELRRGGGTFACEETNTCPTDGRIAIDGDRTCDALTDAVSLGLNGSFTVAFDREVRGCWLEIAELHDRVEGYEVYLCDGPPDLPGLRCARGGDPVGHLPRGGGLVVRLPF